MAAHDALVSVMARVTEQWSAAVAARELAVDGVPVFPAIPGGKRPLTEHGFHDATTDVARVESWWRDSPAANIGVATGAASGVVVVDVDVHGPINGHGAMGRARQAGLVDGWLLLVATPSGGTHAYYRATPGVRQRSWQAARAGIDFRGDGGYIVVPPSAVDLGGATVPYRVRQVNRGSASAIDAEGLRNFLDPRPLPPRPRESARVQGREDVARLAAWVAARQEGERNRSLFWAACRLAESNVPASDALDVLTAAAEHAGLSGREVSTTVRSAYRTAGALPSPQRGPQPATSDTPQRGSVRSEPLVFRGLA
jgi:hypothetical protein